jgi:hypothetical protein
MKRDWCCVTGTASLVLRAAQKALVNRLFVQSLNRPTSRTSENKGKAQLMT